MIGSYSYPQYLVRTPRIVDEESRDIRPVKMNYILMFSTLTLATGLSQDQWLDVERGYSYNSAVIPASVYYSEGENPQQGYIVLLSGINYNALY